jgi:outer membrane lipoprotein carrier protein
MGYVMRRAGISALMLAAITVGAVTVAATDRQAPQAAELAARLQAHYDTVRSFSADFSQTDEGGPLNLPTTERGTLILKKPGRFRMEYTRPMKKTFVADGTMMYSLFHEDKIGSRSPLPREDEASTALQFIAGRGHLTRDFTAQMADVQPAGEWQLVLTPRTRQAEYDRLTLMVDRTTLALRGFSWTDGQGGTTTTRLQNLRENAQISESAFEFSFPRGVIIR